MQPGDTIDLDITSVAHGGVFVGRHEGRVVFVPDVVPGERVRVRFTHTGERSFWRAEALEVLDASPHRRPHVWTAADIARAPEDRAGGADFGHIRLEHQRTLKLDVLRDALTRIGRLEVPVTIVGADGESDDATRWRTRVGLHVDDAGRVGPYAARSHTVVEVDDLPLATAEIERAAAALGGGVPGRIDLVQPEDGRVRVLARPAARVPRTRERAPRTRDVVIERAAGRAFQVDAGGFWQVHRRAADTLARIVGGVLAGTAAVTDPDAEHLDLYGGVGLFAAVLGQAAGTSARVVSIESDARATEHARHNLADWTGARAETARVDRWLARVRQEASPAQRKRLRRGVVVLDPPRSGAGADVVGDIAALAPASVVYVACDPVALARDLRSFGDLGYECVGVDAVDLFPHSHHVEAVAALTRTDAGR